MHLRDKGEIQKFYNKEKGGWYHMICNYCFTPLRIARRRDESATVKWCWQCEWIVKIAEVMPNDDDDFLRRNRLTM